MLDFLVELFIDIIGEGLTSLVLSPRVPRWLRVLLVMVCGGGIAAFLVYLAVLTAATSILLILLFAVLIVGDVALMLYALFKIFR